MAALSYLLLPITGLIALAVGSDARIRFHAMQSIVFGLVWAVALYAGAAVAPVVTKTVFAVGAVGWLVLIVTTAVGRDPRLPAIGSLLQRAAADDLRTGA